MRKLFLWLTATVFMGLTANAQEFFEYDAPVPDSVPKSDGQRSYYGNDHTPKGHLHVLYVCVQFEQDEKNNETWPSNSLPTWHDRLFYESMNEFTDTATDLSLSNYYYQNSKFGEEPFYVTGEFADLVKIPVSGGTPFSHNSEVFAQLKQQYPNKDWSGFDLRTNHTSSQVYRTDNSNTPSDSKFDYVVVQYRVFGTDWYEDLELTYPGYSAVASSSTGNISSTEGSWQVNGDGHTLVSGIGFFSARDLFLHEMAHNLYINGHYGYANGVPGDFMHMNLFWSMMRPNLYMMDASCAWERYMLKWLDIKHDIDSETDTRNPFIIGDFSTTGDAVRIEIPNTGQHLWIEYHNGDSYLDNRPVFSGTSTVDFPQPKKGVYAYVEDLWADRETDFYGNVKLNGVKVVNGDGYFKYWHNENAQVYPGYWWPPVYTFNQVDTEPQPYGGFGHNTPYVDDYNNNDEIDYWTSSQRGELERGPIYREGASEPEGEFTYNFFSGNTATLQEGTIYSAFSNPPIINHVPLNDQKELSNIKLHGLRIWFFKQNDEIWVHVDYDNEIKNNTTFTNKVIIPQGESIQIKEGIIVDIEKSKVPNRVGNHTDGFITPSIFTVDQNASFVINEEASFIVKQDSKLQLNDGSEVLVDGTLEIKEQAEWDINGHATITKKNLGGDFKISKDITINNDEYLTIGQNINITSTQKRNIYVYGTLELTNQQLENIDVEIKNGGKLIIEDDVTFNANSNLIVQQGGVIEPANGSSYLTINGELSLPSGIQIANFTQNNTGGITFNGTGGFDLIQANIQNTRISATFDGYNPQIEDCNFNNSPLYMMGLESHGCYVANNQFTNTTGAAALKIEGFPTYTISGNTISGNQTHAISLYKAGRKTEREHLIIKNTIHHNSDLNAAKGIVLYGSVADIRDNIIYSNDYGLGIYHNSSVRMWGVPELASQQVYANEYNQIFAADNSFPWYFKWNIIQDAGNPNHIIYCKDDKPVRYDVRDNCWGDKFNPNDDLYPTLAFTWDPVWDCGINVDGSGTAPAPRVAYETSLEQIANEDYAGAETQLQSIVETWPDSKYAATAMKTMPDVAVKRNNLDQLISYFNTNATIQADEDLKKLAGYLTADCNVIKANYQQALDFYAGIIDNPPTPEDETYAIIDAGYVHYLMDEGNKAQGTFKHAELIPQTRQAYVAKRKQLLDEIGAPKLEASQEQKTVEEPENLQNFSEGLSIYPNPVSGKVNLEFYTQETGTTIVEVINTAGQCVYSHASEQTEGKVNHSLSTTNMDSGIYYVQIRINDKYVTGKKMVVY